MQITNCKRGHPEKQTQHFVFECLSVTFYSHEFQSSTNIWTVVILWVEKDNRHLDNKLFAGSSRWKQKNNAYLVIKYQLN